MKHTNDMIDIIHPVINLIVSSCVACLLPKKATIAPYTD